MKHNIVSFVHKNLNPKIAELQLKVFNKNNIPLEFFYFEGTHHGAIDYYLENNDWDIITLFDVDCIPLDKSCIDYALEVVDDDTIYGNAQIMNPYSFPYAAPSFVTFTKKLYETSTLKTFHGGYFPNDFGEMAEADCGEKFIKENLKRGKKQILSFPKQSFNYKWRYSGNEEYPPFKYGNGTLFQNNTYHNFEIRLPEVHELFINFVENYLKNEN